MADERVRYFVEGECEKKLIDELKRATNIKQITDITGSKSIGDFKSDFLRLKSCVTILNRHGFDISKMWCTKPEGEFASFSQDFSKISRKTKKK